VQRVSRRGLRGDRHAQDAGWNRGVRDPPGEDLDVTAQLITVGDLKFGVVSDRQAAGPGEDTMQWGRQAAPAARGERHRGRQAAGERAGSAGQIVLGQGWLAGKGLGERVPARADTDGRAQRPEPAQRSLQRLGPQVQADRGPGHGGEHAAAHQQGQRQRAAGRGPRGPATPPVSS